MRKEKLKELIKYVDELKWIKDEIVESNKHFVTVESHLFTFNDRKLIKEKIYKGKRDGSAVIVIPMIKDTHEFAMVIEPRVFTKNRVAVGFPAGYIENGEDPKDAAFRELKEETGYVPREMVHLDSFYQDEGISGAYNHIFLGLDCVKESDQSLDEGEIIRVVTFNYDELFELEKMEYLCSSNAKLALCRIKGKK